MPLFLLTHKKHKHTHSSAALAKLKVFNSPSSARPGESRMSVGGKEGGMLGEGVVGGMIGDKGSQQVNTYGLNMYDYYDICT